MMIQGIIELVGKYNLFLIDLYGVMHDGINHFEKAAEAVNYLRDEGKKVIFFSNTPRPKEDVERKLIGMSPKLKDFEIVTSGEFFKYTLRHPKKYDLDFLSQYAFPLSNNLDHPLLTIPNLKITNSIETASYLLIIASVKNKADLSMFDRILEQAVKRNLPCICPNPDLVARQGKDIIYTAGSFALKYKELGGNVYYMGKPENNFYKFALDNNNIITQYVLAVGDNLYTDIKGANGSGLDSLFVKNGVCDKDDVNTLMNIGLKPTYIIDDFKLK
ncbi:MAG: Ribonucleotide monophosphatase NagD, HAD superfamily [Candidatus Midichloria mitochondrii]|uniref:Sugar phosphatase of the HAD superfamily n=1 Tax=Midichloria mitochondrii (strain IricVA) TaxID=696127 RepID=F7XUN6_MIDMI|nr:TIGR01459 family HAD-type hydrolase [Candidatus Midichloria mitochondrii]AEI88385.1 sugar phosphatase of the HAD superfamily [Candidatus Midichloria mitochondrii IricVA]MDJ1256969.1 TIGR01459 family HAD-type hydrolase [Candidatus Midichloria mitochondrii]MDJ1288719.1 TIGR01459 family HAD-type hydrolase [Candidatus Midichloria mitochondrii]MDJ1299545.1 TIGR01459 family HAD-type hydrolase [Candidatus Midichloria mitochondrii]MDJ1313393.1 TIGR01459 family HAD-type hydrolase [Candidatus Midichl